jgi:Holliday junction DNA helicase RuvB
MVLTKNKKTLSIRPQTLKDYIGQASIKKTLGYLLDASKIRKEALGHLLFYGQAGTGKTTIANIIGNELKRDVKTCSGATITKPSEIVAIFKDIKKGGVLFIDEIHRLPRNIEEELYPAMEDFKLDVFKGSDEEDDLKAVTINLPKFTMIGATTRLGLLTAPLRNRFRNTFKIEDYTLSEMETIIKRSAYRLKIKIDKGALNLIAKRSRYIPRIANNLLLNTFDYATVKKAKKVSYEIANITLKDLKIDDLGLTEPDRKFLKIVAEKSKTRPIGVKSIAQVLNEEVDIVEEIYEPYLLQLGFIDRMVNGRIITKKGLEYLKKK